MQSHRPLTLTKKLFEEKKQKVFKETKLKKRMFFLPRDAKLLKQMTGRIYVPSNIDQENKLFVALIDNISGDHAYGLCANDKIKKGDVIVSYAGESLKDQNKLSYFIFQTTNESGEVKEFDADKIGNAAAYINEAGGEPNVVTSQKQTADGVVVEITAITDIGKLQQILMDYGDYFFAKKINGKVYPDEYIFLNPFHNHESPLERLIKYFDFYHDKTLYNDKLNFEMFEWTPETHLCIPKVVHAILENDMALLDQFLNQQAQITPNMGIANLPIIQLENDGSPKASVEQRFITPLMVACALGRVDMVEKLLAHGALPNIKHTRSGKNALFYTLLGPQQSRSEILNLLLKNEARIFGQDRECNNFLNWCIEANDLVSFKQAITHYINNDPKNILDLFGYINADDHDLFLYSIEKYNFNFIKEIIHLLSLICKSGYENNFTYDAGNYHAFLNVFSKLTASQLEEFSKLLQTSKLSFKLVSNENDGNSITLCRRKKTDEEFITMISRAQQINSKKPTVPTSTPSTTTSTTTASQAFKATQSTPQPRTAASDSFELQTYKNTTPKKLTLNEIIQEIKNYKTKIEKVENLIKEKEALQELIQHKKVQKCNKKSEPRNWAEHINNNLTPIIQDLSTCDIPNSTFKAQELAEFSRDFVAWCVFRVPSNHVIAQTVIPFYNQIEKILRANTSDKDSAAAITLLQKSKYAFNIWYYVGLSNEFFKTSYPRIAQGIAPSQEEKEQLNEMANILLNGLIYLTTEDKDPENIHYFLHDAKRCGDIYREYFGDPDQAKKLYEKAIEWFKPIKMDQSNPERSRKFKRPVDETIFTTTNENEINYYLAEMERNKKGLKTPRDNSTQQELSTLTSRPSVSLKAPKKLPLSSASNADSDDDCSDFEDLPLRQHSSKGAKAPKSMTPSKPLRQDSSDKDQSDYSDDEVDRILSTSSTTSTALIQTQLGKNSAKLPVSETQHALIVSDDDNDDMETTKRTKRKLDDHQDIESEDNQQKNSLLQLRKSRRR